MITLIVACDSFGVIGKNGTLPWRIPEDLKKFREITMGHAIIMGRKTWESLPKKPLDGRANVVISRTTYIQAKEFGPHYYGNLANAIQSIRSWSGENEKYAHKDIFIIGGAQIYKTALEEGLVDKIIMSKIHQLYEGDVMFPKLGDEWTITMNEGYELYNVLHYRKNIVNGY